MNSKNIKSIGIVRDIIFEHKDGPRYIPYELPACVIVGDNSNMWWSSTKFIKISKESVLKTFCLNIKSSLKNCCYTNYKNFLKSNVTREFEEILQSIFSRTNFDTRLLYLKVNPNIIWIFGWWA